MSTPTLAIVWGKWGPYHQARYRAFAEAASPKWRVIGVQYSKSSIDYDWADTPVSQDVITLEAAEQESAYRPFTLWRKWQQFLKTYQPSVVMVPSYWHWSLHMNAMARQQGCRVVMLNESHGGTEQASGWKRGLKRALVSRFDAALVGGSPHKRYFASLGLPESRIFTGYDAVDNAYFETAADAAREQASQRRQQLCLPQRYWLSLGRMVPKKNLTTLIEAYAALTSNDLPKPSLVFVGSGDCEPALRERSQQLGLKSVTVSDADGQAPGAGEVGFYGFRQIDQNPTFFALADAFILPSRHEEWGLVVNEAMACGTPVIVSETAGCAEDLITHKVSGLLFDPASTAALTDHLQAILADPALRETLSANGHERIAQWGCDTFANNALAAAEKALSYKEDAH